MTNRNGSHVLDDASLTRARDLAGPRGYVTDIEADLMPTADVISDYHDRWHVEQFLRMSQTDLAARPMFARTHHAIEDHLPIAFAALEPDVEAILASLPPRPRP